MRAGCFRADFYGKNRISPEMSLRASTDCGTIIKKEETKKERNTGMRFLLTGFAPFGKSRINPSYEAVRLLPDRLEDHEIVKAELPVVYGQAAAHLLTLVKEIRPDCVLSVGQAAGRTGFSLESTAVNRRGASAPDNAGNRYSGEVIEKGAPASLPAHLPLEELLAALQKSEIPANISPSAGTYVCNDLFYSLMRYIETEAPSLMGGFVHIPAIKAQAADFPVGTPTMPLTDIVRAIEIIITAIGN